MADHEQTRRRALLAEIRRVGGAWTSGNAWAFYRNNRLATFRATARLDLAYWARQGELVQRAGQRPHLHPQRGHRMTTTAQAGAHAPAAGLTGRLADLYATIRRQRGRWNATRTVRLYRRLDTAVDLPDTKVRAVARGDLHDLAAWGFLTLHDEPSNRHYTLNTRSTT